MNNIKSLFNEKIDEFDGEPLFYISGLRSDGFKVLLVGKNEREAALKNYSSIFSCHVWGFRTKDYNEQVDEFKFSQTPLELGIRSNEVPCSKIKSTPIVAPNIQPQMDLFKSKGGKKEGNSLKNMFNQKTTVKKVPVPEQKKEVKPADKTKSTRKADFFANARAKGKSEEKAKPKSPKKEAKEEPESLSDCDDPMENRQTPEKIKKKQSKVFENKSKPTRRSRVIMSDDSEDDEKDKMDVDEVADKKKSPKKKSPKKLKVAKNRRRVALESDSESDEGNNLDSTGGRLLFGGSDEEDLGDSVKNVSLMSEDEIERSDEEKENKKRPKEEPKEEAVITKFGSAKVKPGKIMKKVQKKRTYVDEDGNMVTEKYFEEVEVDPSEIAEAESKTNVKPSIQKLQPASKAPAKKISSKPKHQPSISSFFMKTKKS